MKKIAVWLILVPMIASCGLVRSIQGIVGQDIRDAAEAAAELVANLILEVSEPETLFVGEVVTAEATGQRFLFQVSRSGTVSRVRFLDEDRNEIDVQVERIDRISDTLLGLTFRHETQSYRVIYDISADVAYDFSDYSSASFVYASEILLLLTDGALYKTDLSRSQLLPLNNPEYDAISDIYMVSESGDILANAARNAWDDATLFDIAGSIPVLVDLPLRIVDDPTIIRDWPLFRVGYSRIYESYPMVPDPEFRLFEYTLSGGSFSLTSETDIMSGWRGTWYGSTSEMQQKPIVVDLDRLAEPWYILHLDGYIRVGYDSSTQSITHENIAIDSAPWDEWSDLVIDGHYVFGVHESSLKRADFTSADAIVTYPAANLISWGVIHGSVVVTTYATATEVHTFLLGPSFLPQLVREERVEIVQIERF